MQELFNIIKDKDRVILGNIEKKYLSDVMERRIGTAKALVFALTTEEVSKIMRFAWENKIPVTPRGAGTNLVGSTVPHGGIILDLSRMNHILKVDPQTFTAEVEPGVVLKDFQEYVESMGLFYPPDPGEKIATIGGNISTNAGGMRAVKYGVTRDYVRALTVVLANGDVMTLGASTVKNASGLDLKQLVIGSEGTLAVITKCLLRLVAKPEASLSALVPFASMSEGIASVPEILRAGVQPTAVEFMDKSVVELGEKFMDFSFPFPEAKAFILLTVDGNKDEIESRIEKLKAVTAKCGAVDFLPLRDQDTTMKVWGVRGCLVRAVEAVSEQEPVDLVVPINKTADFLAFVHETEKKTGVQMVAFGHAGDGNVHLCIVRGKRSQEEWDRDLHNCMVQIYNEAYQLGGITSGEHGIGISKQPYFFSSTDPLLLRLQRDIKTTLDERHILNDHISYLD